MSVIPIPRWVKVILACCYLPVAAVLFCVFFVVIWGNKFVYAVLGEEEP